MYRKIILFVVLSLTGINYGVMANPIQVGQAQTVAANYARQTGMKIAFNNDGTLTNISATTPYKEFYVFTGSDGNGFVMVSGDDCVLPILGSSDHSRFDSERIPDHVQAWLMGYEKQIRQCREKGMTATDSVATLWRTLLSDQPKDITPSPTTIGPLIMTHWNQAPYYNTLCPIDNRTNEQSITGCIATAMAQLMNYHRHPAQGEGSKTYTPSHCNTQSVNFGTTTYDWDNMPEQLTATSTPEQITAVATLMYHCGVAANMNYGSDASGANIKNTRTAFINYFKYQPDVTYMEKENYADDTWKSILRQELISSRPVLYCGDDGSTGHAFVCDGYNSNGMFHFNWGWSGDFDGYYTIGTLNPGGGGYGANSSGNYSQGNTILINCTPRQENVGSTARMDVVANNAAYGNVSGSGTYTVNSTATASVISANSGYRFICWSNGVTATSTNVTIRHDTTIAALFDDLGSNTQGYCSEKPTGQSNSAQWAIRIPAPSFARYHYLEAVALYIQHEGTYTINVFDGDANPNATPLGSKSVSASSADKNRWHTIYLDMPVATDNITSYLWIQATATDNGTASYAHYAANPDGSYLYTDGAWSNITYGTWMLQGQFSASTVPCLPVSNVTVNDITQTSATVSWTAPNGTTPATYTVAYGTGSTPGMMDMVSANSTSATLSDLQPNTQYNVYVRAEYNDFSSRWISTSFQTASTPTINDPIHITVNSSNSNRGTTEGTGTYQRGSTVTITAYPLVGYDFAQWNDGNTDNPRTITANADATYSATFAQQMYTVTIHTQGAGSINVLYSNDVTYSDNTFSAPYLARIGLQAKATDGSGYYFTQWDDGITNNPRYITVVGDTSYTAVFEPLSAKGGTLIYAEGLTLKVHTLQNGPIRIYDIYGRCLYDTETDNSFLLPQTGIYIVRIGDSHVEKVFVK